MQVLANIDVSDVVLEDDWINDGAKARARKFPRIHGQVQTLSLMWSIQNDKSKTFGVPAPKTEFYAKYIGLPVFQRLTDVLTEHLGDGYYAKIHFIKLPAGREIPMHRDLSNSFEHTTRVSVPIVTNPGVWLTVSGVDYHPEVGEVFVFDNWGVVAFVP